MKNCPCNSGKEFKNCCEPYIQGIKKPPTAEALMRSRYSAYVVKDIAYIEKTNDPNDQEPFDFESAKQWADSAEWLGLEIVDSHLGQENDDKGEIEFKARFKADGKEHVHHERSLFIKRDDQWFFEAGKIVQMPDRRTEPKIGRNDPCKCGSGKKYKKCCGN